MDDTVPYDAAACTASARQSGSVARNVDRPVVRPLSLRVGDHEEGDEDDDDGGPADDRHDHERVHRIRLPRGRNHDDQHDDQHDRNQAKRRCVDHGENYTNRPLKISHLPEGPRILMLQRAAGGAGPPRREASWARRDRASRGISRPRRGVTPGAAARRFRPARSRSPTRIRPVRSLPLRARSADPATPRRQDRSRVQSRSSTAASSRFKWDHQTAGGIPSDCCHTGIISAPRTACR